MDIAVLSKYWYWYLLASLIGIAVGAASYRTSFPPVSKTIRMLLAVLRGTMIFLIGVFLIEPVLNLYSWNTVIPKLAVLFDTSGSMDLKTGDRTRLGLARAFGDSVISATRSDYDIFSFDENLMEIDKFPDKADTSGNATAISSALEALKGRKDFDDYGAVLLVTDGRQNLGAAPVETALSLGVPVHTLTVGAAVEGVNISLDDIAAPASAYSGDDFKIETRVKAEGVKAEKSKAFLKLDGRMIAERQFDVPREGRFTTVEFDVKAPEPGLIRYEVEILKAEGESESVDNKRVVSVNVLKNRIKVLLCSDVLDWEYKFIKQSLSGFDEFQIDAVYQLEEGRFSAPGPPNTFAALAEYDIVIMVNCAPGDVRIARPNLVMYVEEGGSLVYVAGSDFMADYESFGDLLPIETERPLVNQGEFLFEPSPTRKQHAAILLNDDPETSSRLWYALPPLAGIISGIKPAGDVLLETRANFAGQDAIPVLTVGDVAKGRTAIMTGYPVWRSYFGARHENAIAIPTFWKNLVRWATAKSDAKNFDIVTERDVYRLGEPIRLTGYLYDESNQPKGGALVTVSVYPKGDDKAIKDIVLAQSAVGIYKGELTSLAPGEYKFKAFAQSYGDTVGTTDGEFVIEKFSLELASSAPDYNLTSRISEATGGRAYTVDNFSEFINDLKLTPFEREKHSVIKPFGMPIFLIIVLCGLCLEWGMRKRLRLP